MMIRHSRPSIEESDVAAVTAALRADPGEAGRQVRRFERELARTVGQEHGVATCSGTAALHLALLALGVGEGDEVLIPSYVCTAVLNAVNYTRATPVLADVDEETGTLDPEDAWRRACLERLPGQGSRRATARTKAVIAPHLFGRPVDLTRLQDLGLPIIEDCAQALGAKWRGQPVGSFGIVSVFSFYSTKVITTGEGGMACTSSAPLADRMRALRDYDQREDYEVRFNYKMSDLQASLGLAQLARLPDMVARRRELAQRYDAALDGLGLALPPRRPDCEDIHYRYVIRADHVHQLIGLFAQRAVECKRPVFRPLHHYLNGDRPELPRTDRFYAQALSLPLYPALADAQADRVMEAARAVLGAPGQGSRMMVGSRA
jgi:dTDP-4-amino-4,6-dideoxygalactose transaminase